MYTQNPTRGALLLPLLHALSDLGEGAHAFSVVTENAGLRMGLTTSCLGFEASGRPNVLSQASNAGWTLRERGLVVSEGRNWRLTQLGRDVVEGKAEMPPTPKPQKKKTHEQIPQHAQGQKMVEAEAVAADRLAELKVAGSPTPSDKTRRRLPVLEIPESAPSWVRDPYLRAIVTSNTRCFSSWSPLAEECSPCDIQRFCRQAQAASLSVLASLLSQGENLSPVAKQLHNDVREQLDATTSRSQPGLESGQKMRAVHEGLCALSGATIAKGDECVYIPGQGLVTVQAYENHMKGASV